jgi:hypothetical protein
LTAAAAAGPASRPLPLYYALNQAGRAIAASNLTPDQLWEPKRHGLSIGEPPDGSLQQVELKPQPNNAKSPDSLRILAAATNTSRLVHKTTLAQIWGSIPGLPVPGLGAGTPRPIPVEVTERDDFVYMGTIRGLNWLPATPGASETLRKMLGHSYPRAADGLVVAAVNRDPSSVGGSMASLRWRGPDGKPIPVHRVATRYLGGYWLMPSLNQQRDVLGPLMLWWCLLLALSDLARYHPAEWTAALDPNEAWTTVPIEQVLELALEIVPRLVLLELSPGAVGR